MSGPERLDAESVGRWMEQNDRFARLLGIELHEVVPGSCRVSLKVVEDHLNAVGMTHGGVTFTLADFAFAVACNAHGTLAVALVATINFPAASRVGDLLTATASEESRSRRTALYRIEVRTQDDQLVGLFSGTAHRTSRLLELG